MRSITCGFACLLTVMAANAAPNERVIAYELLDFGGSIGQLLYVSVSPPEVDMPGAAVRFQRLGQDVHTRVLQGNAVARVTSGPFEILATTLGVVAVTDPEPVTKVVAATTALAAKKGADAIGSLVKGESDRQALGILKRGLEDPANNISAEKFLALTPEQRRVKVRELKIGGQSLKKVTENLSDAGSAIENYLSNIDTDVALAALAATDSVKGEVAGIRAQLEHQDREMKKYYSAVTSQLSDIKGDVKFLLNETEQLATKTDALTKAVHENSNAIADIASVSFMGWTTDQKLEALNTGMFPELDGEKRAALAAQLQAQKTVEARVAKMSKIATQFDQLAQVASNLGVNPKIVKGLQIGNALAVAAAATTPLGAISALSSLGGLGKPDPTAAALAQISKQLVEIRELQVKTLQSIENLNQKVDAYHAEVMGALDTIGYDVMRSVIALQRLLKDQWEPCAALQGNPQILNGSYRIQSREILLKLLRSTDGTTANFSDCYKKLDQTLNAKLASGDWAGGLVDSLVMPSPDLVPNDALFNNYRDLARRQREQYATTRAYWIAKLNSGGAAVGAVSNELVKIGQPVRTIPMSRSLDAALAQSPVPPDAACAGSSLAHPGVQVVWCYQSGGATPVISRVDQVVNSTLFGPQVYQLMEHGMLIASLADFAVYAPGGSLRFVSAADVESSSLNGVSKSMREALEQQKGFQLLQRIRWLADLVVFQQSMMFGHHTVESILADVYSKDARTIDITLEAKGPAAAPAAPMDKNAAVRRHAIAALKANKVLQRNVVLTGMRRVMEETTPNAEAGLFRRVAYQTALQDISKGEGCAQSRKEYATRALEHDLFPNWHFDYRVAKADREADKTGSLTKCMDPPPGEGTGVYVLLSDDVLVRSPDPQSLYLGSYELTDGLSFALAMRDRLVQAIVDRGIRSSFDKAELEASVMADAPVEPGQLALEYLTESALACAKAGGQGDAAKASSLEQHIFCAR